MIFTIFNDRKTLSIARRNVVITRTRFMYETFCRLSVPLICNNNFHFDGN